MKDNSTLPTKESIESLLNGEILLIEAEDLEQRQGLKLICEIEQFIELLRREKSTAIFYQYSYYDIDRFCIKDEWLEQQQLPAKKRNKIQQEIREYNDDLKKRFDFGRPYQIVLLAFISNGRVIKAAYEDAWLESDSDDEDDVIIASPQAMFDSLLFENEIEKKAFILQEIERREKNIDLGNEMLFNFLVSDPRFAICTTKESRRDYVRMILANEKNLLEKLQELDYTRNLEFVVDAIWNIKKKGMTEFTDDVKQMLAY